MDAFSDLAFFTLLARHGSLTATAQELGISPPAVSKRLLALERRLGVRLLNRTTRRTSLTPEGETYLVDGTKVLQDLEALERLVSGSRAEPRGIVRMGATLGFGRRHLVPALADFAHLHPEVEVQLQLTDRPINLVEQGLDLVLRFGELPDARLTARLLAHNRRLLCAAHGYLQRAGEPATPADLARHQCIVLRESDETFGTWHLASGARQEMVKVRGRLSTNDGEAATSWALQGHGIVLRSQWDVAPALRAGTLQRVLPAWQSPPTDVFLVFQAKAHLPSRTRALVDFLMERFEPYRHKGAGPLGPW